MPWPNKAETRLQLPSWMDITNDAISMLKIFSRIPYKNTIKYNSLNLTILMKELKCYSTRIVRLFSIRLQLRPQQLLLRICCACWSQHITYLSLWRRFMYESRAPCWRTTEVRLNESMNPYFVRFPTDRATYAHKTPSESRVCNELKSARTTFS